MKVLFISNDPLILEEGSSVHLRMRAYADALGELHILMRSHTNENRTLGTLSLHTVRASRLTSIPTLIRRARSLICELGIQIVSAQDPFEHGWVARDAVRGTSAKLHIQVHTDFLSPEFSRGLSVPRLINRVRCLLADRVLPAAEGIRVVSERVRRSLVSRYSQRIPEPAVLPIAVSTLLPEPIPLPEHSFTFTLITVGRLEEEKHSEDILEAIARVTKRYPSVGLVVVGEGRRRRFLEARARSLGIEKQVLFLGSRSDALGLMRSAQAYVQASAYEGYGMTLIEAALCGLPSITTNVGIIGEVLMPERDVLVVEQGDVVGIAAQIEKLVADNWLRKQLSMNAQRTAQEHCSQQESVPQQIAKEFNALLVPHD